MVCGWGLLWEICREYHVLNFSAFPGEIIPEVPTLGFHTAQDRLVFFLLRM